MTYTQFKKLVKEYGGWIEKCGSAGEYVARFPSVYQREQFEKATAND